MAKSLNIAVGFVVSFVVAYFVIRQFLVIVARYGLTPFGWYRIAAGLALAAYLLDLSLAAPRARSRIFAFGADNARDRRALPLPPWWA